MHSKREVLPKVQEEALQTMMQVDDSRITLMWDEKGIVEFVSRSVERYFELKAGQLLHDSWESIFPELVVQRIKNHFEHHENHFYLPHEAFETKLQETYFSIKIVKKLIQGEQAYICLLIDETENVHLKNKMKRIEKLMLSAKMSANVVHEIRNPLTSIKGFLQLIQAGVEHKDEYVKVLINEVDKLEHLTQELLQIAKPSKTKKTFVNVENMINDVLLLMKAQSNLRDINFEVSGKLNVTLHCNANEIKQVLINLIYNAAEAMGCKGKIKIHVRELRDSVILEVIDHGPGMSQQTLEKVSDEFYTTKENGTGLGLVVTEQIIKKHNGQLSIFSLENVGSTFEVKLPI